MRSHFERQECGFLFQKSNPGVGKNRGSKPLFTNLFDLLPPYLERAKYLHIIPLPIILTPRNLHLFSFLKQANRKHLPIDSSNRLLGERGSYIIPFWDHSPMELRMLRYSKRTGHKEKKCIMFYNLLSLFLSRLKLHFFKDFYLEIEMSFLSLAVFHWT